MPPFATQTAKLAPPANEIRGRALALINSLETQKKAPGGCLFAFGADYGARTRHLDLGKVALYQMS